VQAFEMTDDTGLTEAIDHYHDGRVRLTGVHLDGEMHGDWTFYRADGSVKRTGSFDRGRQVGVWNTIDRPGKVVKVTEFARPAGLTDGIERLLERRLAPWGLERSVGCLAPTDATRPSRAVPFVS
jgi:hypothetical protein